jgi:hypothetical protein
MGKGRIMTMVRWLLLGGLVLGGAACELTEVITPASRELVVVEAVLRADGQTQRFLLHRSLDGRIIGGVEMARVAVLTPDGSEVVFLEDTPRACIPPGETLDSLITANFDIRATCYTSPDDGGWVRPGEEYQLRIETADGRDLRGRTRVPGDFGFLSPALPSGSADEPPRCLLPPGTRFPLVWSASPGAWAYLATMDVFGLDAAVADLGLEPLPEPVRLRGIAISEADTTLVLPSQFGLFERGDLDQELLVLLQGGFPPDVDAEVVVAAYDRNLVNAVRGGAFNPSGNVRISSVVGDGVGVFGSLVPRSLQVSVRASGRGIPCLPPGG